MRKNYHIIIKMFSKSLLKPSDYNILENLGEGPFGKTYLVENKIKRLSAVKVFRNAYDEEQKISSKK